MRQQALCKFNLKPNRKINGWTLSSKLGSGGNGEVWRCRNDKKEEFAIKFFKFGRFSASYMRFRDEVMFMEKYQHISGILPVIEKYLPSKNTKNVDKAIPLYYVMPLAKPIDRELQLYPLEKKIEVIKMLLDMLVELHQNDIAHRDIKPANILFYKNKYVLSDFGLVYFNKKEYKTPAGIKIGAKQTISPQMERDAQSANRFKSDVYSMAKTIWIILTGDSFSFHGQYIANSEIGLSRKIKCDKYLYPLDKLLSQCTDLSEATRPTAKELRQRFEEWTQINASWSKINLMQWKEIQECLFPTIIPTRAEWSSREDIVKVLRLLGKYGNLNHMFFPDGGGLDLTDAAISYEPDCIELICDQSIYIVKPKKLMFEFINEEVEWNYFFLETDTLKPNTPNFSEDNYMEELYETSPLKYSLTEICDNMPKEECEISKPRQVGRYLKGSFVFFHKDSLYNHFISKYKGEHDRLTSNQFHEFIVQCADKSRGLNMIKILKNP